MFSWKKTVISLFKLVQGGRIIERRQMTINEEAAMERSMKKIEEAFDEMDNIFDKK